MKKDRRFCEACVRCGTSVDMEDSPDTIGGELVCRVCAVRAHPAGCSCGDPECPENPYRPREDDL